jgi:hypothetical protein
MYLQELGNYNSNLYEYLKLCMDRESFDKFIISYKKNPFIICAFKYIIPQLFIRKNNDKSVDKPEEKKTGIFALIERNKERAKQFKKEEVTFSNFMINFISKTEQDYSIVNKVTYTYLLNINSELAKIAEKEKAERENKDGVKPLENVSTSINKRK